jgi:hypothetical protein
LQVAKVARSAVATAVRMDPLIFDIIK